MPTWSAHRASHAQAATGGEYAFQRNLWVEDGVEALLQHPGNLLRQRWPNVFNRDEPLVCEVLAVGLGLSDVVALRKQERELRGKEIGISDAADIDEHTTVGRRAAPQTPR